MIILLKNAFHIKKAIAKAFSRGFIYSRSAMIHAYIIIISLSILKIIAQSFIKLQGDQPKFYTVYEIFIFLCNRCYVGH